MSFVEKALSKATDISLEKVLSYLSGIALSGLVIAGDWVDAHVTPVVLSLASPELLVRLLIAASTLLLLGFSYWFLRRGLRLKYGIYWDKAKNPHCPICKNPVIYDNWSFGYAYRCAACKQEFPLADATGKKYTPSEVLPKL